MEHATSKTRSLSQTLKKPCVRSGGQIFSLILMKLDQNICLKMGDVRLKTRSLCQTFLCFRVHIFSSILLKFVQNVCLVISWMSEKMNIE